MISLLPKQAAHFANIAYATAEHGGLKTSASFPFLSPIFSFEGLNITAISGSILERIFRHHTPFGCIAKGKTGAFKDHYVLALRGTAKMRDCITDLHYAIAIEPNLSNEL